MFARSFTIIALVILSAQSYSAYSQGRDQIQEAENHIQQKNYDRAIEALSKNIPQEKKDYAAWLTALAQFRKGARAESMKTCNAFLSSYPASQFAGKVRFLRADILVLNKDYKQAVGLYESFAKSLLSEERKEKIARVYIEYAESLAYNPGPDELDLPKPDYNRAFAAYAEALRLEIGDALKEEIQFRMARMKHLALDYYKAREMYTSYLADFDPDWRGPSVNKTQTKKTAGKHIYEARLALAETRFSLSDTLGARLELQDLIRLIEKKGEDREEAGRNYHRLALRRIPFTYNMPFPYTDFDLEAGIKATAAFLSLYPGDPIAPTLARHAAFAYVNRGRTENAIKALRDYSEKKGFNVADKEGAEDKAAREALGIRETPAEQFDRYNKEAVFTMGTLLFGQKKYKEASDTYSAYISRFPNGEHWTRAQSGIVEAQYQSGVELIRAKKYPEAEESWNAFLARNPLDHRSAKILFTIAAISYEEGRKSKEAKNDREARSAFSRALAGFRRLVSKYPNTEEASLAQLRAGEILETELKDLEAALDAYRKLTWGSYAQEARRRVERMVNKELLLRTERIFRTNEQARLKVAVRNIEKLTLSAYKLDLEAYFRKTHGIGGIERLDLSLIAPDKSWSVTIDGYARYLPIEREITVPTDGPGAYAITVSSEELESTSLVIKSDIDIVVKSGKREVLVFAQNMTSGVPVVGAQVIITDGVKVLVEDKTGLNGILHKPVPGLVSSSGVNVFASMRGSVAATGLSIASLGLSFGLSPKGYIYTDLPAYRPGQDVNVKGIIRDVTAGSYTVPRGNGAKYAISVTDPAGKTIHSEEATLGEYGSFGIRARLSERATTGMYTVLAINKDLGRSFSGRFTVERFKLEKVALEVNFDKGVYFRGEELLVQFRASYYYGQPVNGAEIRYTTPLGLTESGKTDENGMLEIAFDSAPFLPGSLLAFSATLVSENVSVKASVPIAMREYDLAIRAAREKIRSGETAELSVVATDASGKRTARECEIAMLEITSVSRDPLFESVPWLSGTQAESTGEIAVESKKISTDETGTARAAFKPQRGGSYVFRVKGTDRLGNVISAETRVFVSGEDDPERLRIFTKKNLYAVGDEDSIILFSRIGKQSVGLLTIEGEGIISYSVMPVKENENPIKISVENSHFPSFAVSVAVMDGSRLHTASVPFAVERGLSISIAPDKPTYSPGEQAQVAIRVTDQKGKPARTELSLALINDALLAIYADNAQDIQAYFQEGVARKAEMAYSTSCSFSYTGITRAVLKEILEEEIRVAEKERAVTGMEDYDAGKSEEQLYDEMEGGEDSFGMVPKSKDTDKKTGTKDGDMLSGKRDEGKPDERKERETASFWIGTITTDSEGKATVSVPMPELISSFTIKLRGVTKETLVGQSETRIVVKKDFFASIKTPAVLQEKDDIRFIGRVHNAGAYSGKAAAVLIVVNGQTEVKRFQADVTVGKSEIKEIVFPAFSVPDVRELEVSLQVKAENGATDSVSRTVQVRPWGIPMEVRKGGAASDSATIFAVLPVDRTYETARLDIGLSPGIETALIDAVTGYDDEDYSSARIPSLGMGPESSLLAVVSVLEYLKNRNADPVIYSRLADKARELAGELVASQAQAGYWSLPDGTENIAITSTAYWALNSAKKAGIGTDDRTLSLARDYLAKVYSSIDQGNNESKALVLHALSRSKDADYTFANRLYRSRNELGEAAIALTAIVLSLLDKNDMGKDMLQVLDSKVKTVQLEQGTGAYWSAEGNGPWLKNPVETTALALLAYQEIEPGSQLIKQAVAYLLSVKENRGFIPGKAMGPAIAALSLYYGKTKQESADYTVSVFVNGKNLGMLDARKSNKAPSMLEIETPLDVISLKENKIELSYSGKGEYFYSVSLQGFSKDVKDPVSWKDPHPDAKKYIHEPLRYGGKIMGVSTHEITELEYNKTMDVRISFSSGYIDRYLTIEEHVPSGCVLLEDTIRGNYSQVSSGEGRIVFVFKPNTYLSDITYSLAPYLPGKFDVLPPVLYDAFYPSRMRLGPEKLLTVLASGETSREAYVMNETELYAVGSALFADKKYGEALELLERLYSEDHAAHQPDVARRLLWIRTEKEYYDAKKLIDYFEILREKYPELSIPFSKILTVGKAYRDIGEHERSYLVFRATIDASFGRDASAGGYLERSGELIRSMDYMTKLLFEYPDGNPVIAAMFALGQELYLRAPRAEEIASRANPRNANEKPVKYTKSDILEMAQAMLWKFMTFYPENELCDDAAFTTLNVTLDKKDYAKTVELARDYRARYKEGTYVSSYQFMEALAQFSLRKYDDAVRIAEVVSSGANENSSLATYILGQIYHARRNPARALEFYRLVASSFQDAQGAIDFFESRSIGIDEVSIFAPGERLSVKLAYKNIREAFIQVYRVDLMKLYLQEKNLSRIAGVNLSGITPLIEKQVTLGNGADYETKSRELGLDIRDEGAYLLVIRGDDLFASGLVLLTPLDIIIQEEADSGRIRINVYDKVKKLYPDAVHVKAIGSENSEFVSGDTDMRGIFIADGIRGIPTVIARDRANRYAFYRGKTWLGAAETYKHTTEEYEEELNFDDRYRGNLNRKQSEMNEQNRANLDELYEQDIEGVQVQQAY